MFALVFTVSAAALVTFALWNSQRGENRTVTGSGNAFDAYYGAKKKDAKTEPVPCEQCVQLGCIGAGECRCLCHQTQRIA